MLVRMICKPLVISILWVFSMAACQTVQSEAPTSFVSASPTIAAETPAPPSAAFDGSNYAFPGSIDPAKQYLFYLHGKIIEDQGIPAISPDYGDYEYQAILEQLSGHGLVVISEQRAKNTDSMAYAKKITAQVTALLKAGVRPKNITVVGASKGAGIAIFISHLLENKDLNFVLMAICDPVTIEELKQNQVFLYGNVLSIYDSADSLAGSCQELFSFSEGKGINRHDEIILKAGTGHGIVFKPLAEWITPTLNWAEKP
jgi:hypothetical protein